MKDGFFLRARSLSYECGLPEDVSERRLWLKDGLVLTDDNRVLFRDTAFYIYPGREPEAVLDGVPLYTGPCADLRPCEPLPWFPFCVDGKWGYGDAETGEIAVAPQFAFCDYHEMHFARYSTKGEFGDLEKECCDGVWGLLDDGLEETIPPIYQYLSCVQNDILIARKDGHWGMLDCWGHEELPFQWDGMWFAKRCVTAVERAGGEDRWSIFYKGPDCDYMGPPTQGGTREKPLLDGLAAVTVPEQGRADGLPCCCRLVQRAGRWGVVDCVTGAFVEPALDREEAETLFREWEEEWGG